MTTTTRPTYRRREPEHMRLSSNKVQAKCLYPANLRIKLDAGEKTAAEKAQSQNMVRHRRQAEGRLDMQQEDPKRHSVVNIRPKSPHAGRTLNELNARVT